jgi:hypothetical protein
MPDLTDRIRDAMVQNMADIKRNFLNGNRSDARDILYAQEPAAAAWIACQLGGALRIADRQSFLNWLEALATGGVRQKREGEKFTDMTPGGLKAEEE